MKKVLASVLAGSMILGMAAMASAADLIELKTAKLNGDYRIELYKTGSVKFEWPSTVKTALNDYKKEYVKVENFIKAALSNGDTQQDGLTAYEADASNATPYATNYGNLYNLIKTINSSYPALLGMDSVNNYKTAAGNVGPNRMAFFNLVPTPNDLKDALDDFTINDPDFGTGYEYPNKSSVDMTSDEFEDYAGHKHYMYTYGTDDCKEATFEVQVKHKDDFRVDVANGPVTVSRKRIETGSAVDVYEVVIKAKADVRDFELQDFKVELDVDDKVFFIEGDVAYSDSREVLPDERYSIDKSEYYNNKDYPKAPGVDNPGCVFNFDEVIDEETRIICNEYVDMFFKGNYGTDYENLRVMTDDITEVEEFFQDYDIDYYDFIGTPKFAKDVTVRIDADSDSYIYEYDKKTGDVVDITDEAEYTSDGWEFKRKSFKTYVVLEEPYEGGNVKAEKEPVSEEPEDEPEDTEEPADDTNNAGSKPNPGTGAYPLF